jgi:LCP family protein required for cell wall assembly
MAPDRRTDPPPYRVYRSRPRLLRRDAGDRDRGGLDDLREEIPRPDRPEYKVHRGGGGKRPRLPRLRRGDRAAKPGVSWRRVLRVALLATGAWVLVSGVLFMISAQIQRERVDDEASAALTDSGYTLTSPNNILILGSDARSEETAEPGSENMTARSDSILLMRVGGGHNTRLSIARDLLVNIPGHSFEKITHAYAYGGAALTIETIEANFGIEVNHLVEVDFENFPRFVDALGGVTVETGCVVSRINGGNRNGGYTLRLRRGENHLDGRAALALSRTRTNECNPAENDLTRAQRQQDVLSAIKSRAVSPHAFIRLPWVSWTAPQTIRSDMGGAQLLGLFGAVATEGAPATRVLGDIQPDGSVGVSEEKRRAEIERFLAG